MAYLTSAVGEFLSWLLALFGSFYTSFVCSVYPLILFFFLIPLIGLGIGLFKRLLDL